MCCHIFWHRSILADEPRFIFGENSARSILDDESGQGSSPRFIPEDMPGPCSIILVGGMAKKVAQCLERGGAALDC